MKWIELKYRKPACWETGHWDGKKSDPVLCIDSRGFQSIAVAYEGTLDGEYFFEWYNGDDFEVKEKITHWMPLPEPPKHQ